MGFDDEEYVDTVIGPTEANHPMNKRELEDPDGIEPGMDPGRGYCQNLAFLAQLAVLTPQPSQLLALGTGQAVMRAALVTVGLADPVADRLGGWLELPSQFPRRAARAHQLDHLLPEPGWIGRTCKRHRGLLSHN